MTNRDSLDWRAAGACVSADPDLFFPLSATGPATQQAERATRICGNCQVMRPCLEFALEHAEVDGIWGGTTREERLRTRHATAGAPRGAGRPPRQAPRAA
jgi:WhiB family transcriptional regulator, redox-sensing transcriptional regulator